MIRKRHERPQLNAGSMADIAFLLLVFFLVSTVINEEVGIRKMLPNINEQSGVISERNLLEIDLNREGEILLDNHAVELKQLSRRFVDHMYNAEKSITRPRLKKQEALSAGLSPYYAFAEKPMVLIRYDKSTAYEDFVAVQNELRAGYAKLHALAFEEATGTALSDLVESSETHRMMYKAAREAFAYRIAEEMRE